MWKTGLRKYTKTNELTFYENILIVWGRVLQGSGVFLKETVFFSLNRICRGDGEGFLESTRVILLTWNFLEKKNVYIICINFCEICHKDKRRIQNYVKHLRQSASQK